MSKKKSAFIGILSSQIFMIISMALSLISTPFILKYLSKEEYGVFIIFFQIITYLGIFNFGTSATVIRYLSLLDEDDSEFTYKFNKIFSTGILISSVFGAVVIVAAYLLSYNISLIFDVSDYLLDDLKSITKYIGLFVGLQFITRSFGTVSFVRHDQFTSTLIAFINSTISMLFTILFVYLKFGLWSFVYSNFLALFISSFISLYAIRVKYDFVKLKFNMIDKSIVFEMLHYGFFAFLIDVSNQIIVNTDRIVVGSVVSVAAVSVFSITVRIPEILSSLIQRIPDNVYPLLAHKMNEQVNGAAKLFSMLMGTVFSAFIIGMSIIYIFNRDFIKLWVGESFFMGNTILWLSICVAAIQLITRICVLFLTISGKLKSYSLISIVEATANICISVFLGKRMGAQGVLLGTIISSTFTSFLFLFYKMYADYQIKVIDLIWHPIVKPTIISLLIGFVIHNAYQYLILTFGLNWINFILFASVLSGLFLIMSYFVFLRRYVKVDIKNRKLVF